MCVPACVRIPVCVCVCMPACVRVPACVCGWGWWWVGVCLFANSKLPHFRTDLNEIFLDMRS